jgi:geranylgeranyl diphosphate synthase type I
MSVLDRADLRARVQVALDGFVADHRPALLAMGPELAPMADAVQDFLSGGKRLRPAFCFWGHLGAGGVDSDALVLAASSLEVFQASALLHDDVMDGSDTRRGKPSVHRAFEALHRTSAWNGSAEVFGRGAAILLGDLCLAWSDQMLVASGLVTDAARLVFDAMRAERAAGQYLDLLEQVRPDPTVETALRVARYKSAKYTIVEPLLLGAGLADVDLTSVYTSYGMPLGVAFQLRDDLLGVFGDPDVTGKPAGDDLREGKRTVLVAMALETATPAQAELVRRELGSPTAAVDDLRQVLVDTGAVDRVEAMITSGCDEALAALAGSSVAPEAVTALTDLALAATARQS